MNLVEETSLFGAKQKKKSSVTVCKKLIQHVHKYVLLVGFYALIIIIIYEIEYTSRIHVVVGGFQRYFKVSEWN